MSMPELSARKLTKRAVGEGHDVPACHTQKLLQFSFLKESQIRHGPESPRWNWALMIAVTQRVSPGAIWTALTTSKYFPSAP